MNTFFEDIASYSKLMPANHRCWRSKSIDNKNKTSTSIFTNSTHYRTKKLMPIRYYKPISKNFVP